MCRLLFEVAVSPYCPYDPFAFGITTTESKLPSWLPSLGYLDVENDKSRVSS